MYRDIFWTPVTGPGVEHLRFVEGDIGVTAESVVVSTVDDDPFRLRYEIDCDPEYRLRRVQLTTLGPNSSSLTLRTDGEGEWTDGRGVTQPELRGCTDVDISVTPFTNTLPIRRTALGTDESATIDAVYVTGPDLGVEPVSQRYRCLDPVSEDGGRYRYESLTSGFTSELPVDADGIVVDYPDLWVRDSP